MLVPGCGSRPHVRLLFLWPEEVTPQMSKANVTKLIDNVKQGVLNWPRGVVNLLPKEA